MKQRIILLIIPLILLSGCGAVLTTAGAAGGEPTILQVRRVNLVSGTHHPPFSPHTIIDQRAVQRLYNAAQALPHFTIPEPPGWMSCPHDSGLEYQLDFFQKHTLMQEVIFYPGGCSLLRLGEKDVRVYTKSFVQLFVQTIGISEAELFPQPLFSCTPHSPCLSPTP